MGMDANVSNKKRITAKCPKCENLHKVKIAWDDVVMPRIFCPTCKHVMSITVDRPQRRRK